MARQGDFLIRRPDSENWQLQLIIPSDVLEKLRKTDPTLPKKFVRSTHTSDRVVARRQSAETVERFQAMISVFRGTSDNPRSIIRSEIREMEPGRHDNPDGTMTIATERSIITIGVNGKVIDERDNCPTGVRWSGLFKDVFGGTPFSYEHRCSYSAGVGEETIYERANSTKKPQRDIDAEIIDLWAKEEEVDPRFVDETIATLKIFHEVTGRTMATADFEDGCELRDHLYEADLKSATVRKKIAFLRAAFNVAMIRPRKFPEIAGRANPFSRVMRKGKDDALDKVMLDDDDVRLIMSRIDELGRNERHLLIWCLATGCRRSEPFEVTSELKIDGFRSVRFGTKTPQSDRTIPLPPELLELYPDRITGSLFTDSPKAIGRNINRWMRKIGISDDSKTLHSTRHRAAYRLRDPVADSVRWACLGHANRVAPSERYGMAKGARPTVYPQAPLYDALLRLGVQE